MALQQAQLLLHMSSLEPVNFGAHQNNTEAFAVVLCHLAELHAEQVPFDPLRNMDGRGQATSVSAFQGLYGAVSELLQHLKEQFPPHSQNAKVGGAWQRCTAAVPAGRRSRVCSEGAMMFLLSAVDVVRAEDPV